MIIYLAASALWAATGFVAHANYFPEQVSLLGTILPLAGLWVAVAFVRWNFLLLIPAQKVATGVVELGAPVEVISSSMPRTTSPLRESFRVRVHLAAMVNLAAEPTMFIVTISVDLGVTGVMPQKRVKDVEEGAARALRADIRG